MEPEQFEEQSKEWILRTQHLPTFQWEYKLDTLFHNFLTPDNIEFELSITYSHSFKTPVVYLRPVSHIISTSDILSLFPHLKAEFFSQTEHPTTSLPCYFLHPCQSAVLLAGPKPLFSFISIILSELSISISSDILISLFIV